MSNIALVIIIVTNCATTKHRNFKISSISSKKRIRLSSTKPLILSPDALVFYRTVVKSRRRAKTKPRVNHRLTASDSSFFQAGNNIAEDCLRTVRDMSAFINNITAGNAGLISNVDV